jgi:hypothetical protein
MYTKTTPWWIPISVVALAAAIGGVWLLMKNGDADRVNAADVNVITTAPAPTQVYDANGARVVTTSPQPGVVVSGQPVPQPGVTVQTRTQTLPEAPIWTERDWRADITEVRTVTASTRREALVGKRVELLNTPVHDVIGDRTFWVGTGAGERLFCVLDRGLDDGPMEWGVIIRPGQTLSLRGELRPAPRSGREPKWWNFKHNRDHGFDLEEEKVYFHVLGVRQTAP